MKELTFQDRDLIHHIQTVTAKKNIDNISRTKAYFDYFKDNREILWSFLASMVSRNGGWNMCDLEGAVFPHLLDVQTRKQLFLTYERANWLIFHDVFPQLLLYQYSKIMKREVFHLLPLFNVSTFIYKEWKRYWEEKNNNRLMTALIINEQNVIQKPVIDHPVYRNRVFNTMFFSFQDWLHFSCVIFPTCGGELYGASVNGFRSLSKRINLGKRLADILFDPRLFPHFFEFAQSNPHTGSRYDYEQYLKTMPAQRRDTPFLRTTFPVIKHHQHQYENWSVTRFILPTWMKFPVNHHHPTHLTDWYFEKKEQLHFIVSLKRVLNIKKKI